jgi:hypothetical protein
VQQPASPPVARRSCQTLILKALMNTLIFVDSARLSDLGLRLFSSNEVEEKYRELEAGASITGPTVKGAQKTRLRPITVYEQFERVYKKLHSLGHVATQRPLPYKGRDVYLGYVHETIQAYRATIPEAEFAKVKTRPISLWYVPVNEQYGPLLLLEDTTHAGSSAENACTHSSYTVLQSFLHYARERIDQSIVYLQFPRDPPPHYGKVDASHLPSAIYEAHNATELAFEFARNAPEMLKQWGCLLTGPHQVRAFYQVREYGEESGYSGAVSVFGYPIYIERLSPQALRSKSHNLSLQRTADGGR